ncbi:MAG: PAS domain-containing protein [Pseudolabrys sp.]
MLDRWAGYAAARDYPAHAFGAKIVGKLSAGGTVVVDNLFNSAISDEAETLQTASKVDTRAILVVPFLRAGRLRTIVYLNARQERHWSAEEVDSMEEIAERIRQLIERAEAEAAIAASEAEFRTFAQAMPNHVWAAAPDGLLNWFNERTYTYSGAKPGELDGTAWTKIVHHPEDVSAAGLAWQGALAAGKTYEAEFRIRSVDGVYRWHIARALPIRGANGKVIRWIGTNTDIHDQKIAIDALAVLNVTLEDRVAERTADRDRVWRNSQDMLAIVDASGVFRAVSPSVTKFWVGGPKSWLGAA